MTQFEGKFLGKHKWSFAEYNTSSLDFFSKSALKLSLLQILKFGASMNLTRYESQKGQ